jgi:hypothetical protein
MSRDLSSGVISEITSSSLAPFLLFEGVFASGTLRLWSGIGDLSWNSYTWTGVGSLASISSVTESAETSAQGITVSLSGIPSNLVSLFLGDVRQGSAGKVYLGFLDSSNDVIDSPYMLFEGRLDVPAMEESAETAVISITYESRLIDLERPRESRYTDEDQQREFSGDLGFEFVPSLQDIVINWGRTDSSGKSKPTRQV